MSSQNKLKIAYFLDVFPLLSQTFVLNEILELIKSDVDIDIISIFRSKELLFHSEASNLVDQTFFLPRPRTVNHLLRTLLRIISANIYYFIKHPSRYLTTLFFTATLCSFKTLIRLPVSVYLAFILRRNNVGHIHAHFAHIASEYAMLTSMISQIPFSFTIHAFDIFLNPRFLVEKLTFSKFIISISLYNKTFIGRQYPQIDLNKCHVIHCGVNLEKLSPPTEKETERPSFIILSTARLEEKKGLTYLFEACGILKGNGLKNTLCYIIGAGSQREELEKLVDRHGLSTTIFFKGPLPNEKVHLCLQATDVFVLPCIVAKNRDMDGIPYALMEAMALQKPVISTHISGIPELVKDGSGILVPPNDSMALAKAIEEVYWMNLDERKKLGEKGREIVEREFNIKKESKQLLDLFMKSSGKSL